LILGLFSEWEVGARVSGYRNRGDGEFSVNKEWSRDLALRLPPLLEIVRSPEKIFGRVEELDRSFEAMVTGRFSSSDATDLLLLASEPRRLRLWRARPGEAERLGKSDQEDALQELLFDSERTRWALDEIFDWIAGLASARITSLTAGRAADSELETRSAESWLLLGAEPCDLDGDGRDELLVGYEDRGRPWRVVFDVFRF
jgi:hypothetical protein